MVITYSYNFCDVICKQYFHTFQVRELMDTFISKSKADVVILGGDFNAGPVEHEGIM